MDNVKRLPPREIKHGDDPQGILRQALVTAAEQKIRAAVVVMIDESGEEFYAISRGLDAALVGAIEIVKATATDLVRFGTKDEPTT